MILFFAPFPENNEKDGYSQRILAIDSLFKNQKRLYIQISDEPANRLFPERRVISDKITKIIVAKSRIHRLVVYFLALFMESVYFHSVYQTLKFRWIFNYKKVFVDMHGLAPEEQEGLGDQELAKYLERCERWVVNHSHKIIVVTNAMWQHYKSKYGRLVRTEHLVLPIFEKRVYKKSDVIYGEKPTVIYAGSALFWQSLDAMIAAIEKMHNKYKVRILSGDIETFSKLLAEKNLTNKVELMSVAKDEVNKYYRDSHFGLVLRDDSIINRVSCPTKLIEYMSNGVLPIVKESLIGDFLELGYSYLPVDYLVRGHLPSYFEYNDMIKNNYNVILKLHKLTHKSIKRLIREVLND